MAAKDDAVAEPAATRRTPSRPLLTFSLLLLAVPTVRITGRTLELSPSRPLQVPARHVRAKLARVPASTMALVDDEGPPKMARYGAGRTALAVPRLRKVRRLSVAAHDLPATVVVLRRRPNAVDEAMAAPSSLNRLKGPSSLLRASIL